MPNAQSPIPHFIERLPEDAVFIIGAGHFGRRAAGIISEGPCPHVYVVDVDDQALSILKDLPVEPIACDGVQFLIENSPFLRPENLIVPAIPLHLAFEWARGSLERDYGIKESPVPEEIIPLLPNTWSGSDGSLLVSYADFECPDDCPEPEFCTVSGEKRDQPLYESLRRLDLPGFRVHIIVSHQLAPGLGGYHMADLLEAGEVLKKSSAEKWLLGSACKCHGVITAFEIERGN